MEIFDLLNFFSGLEACLDLRTGIENCLDGSGAQVLQIVVESLRCAGPGLSFWITLSHGATQSGEHGAPRGHNCRQEVRCGHCFSTFFEKLVIC